jgi:formylglycine-generating enzyme required for sulfatase activity
MRLAPDSLERMGFRLPTEAEWEYACRAGAATSRYYGETEELLGKYAWYTKNSLDRGMLPGPPADQPGWLGVPGGCLKPNDLGLFDMLGNTWGWCQDQPHYYRDGEDIEDKDDIKYINDTDSRVLRGGSLVQAMYVRSAYRGRNRPSHLNVEVGFRPARTFR